MSHRIDGRRRGGNVPVRVTSEGVIIVDDKLLTLYTDIVTKVKSARRRQPTLEASRRGVRLGGEPMP